MLITDTLAIREAFRSTIMSTGDRPVLAAVAFWGDGAEALFPRTVRAQLICNLSVGGTNPRTIRQLAAMHAVRHIGSLHAKVLIGATQAIIGSANLSQRALGLGSIEDCWHEAVVAVDRASREYIEARAWFQEVWDESEPVDEKALQVAEQLFQREPVPTPTPPGTSPVLSESLLFEDGPIAPRNRIRMASFILKQAFERHVEGLDESNVRVPAFAANLLWTLAGNRMATALPGCPEFTLPNQVLRRAAEPVQPKKSLGQLAVLLRGLSEDAQVPGAIRYWAARWQQRSEEDRLLGSQWD